MPTPPTPNRAEKTFVIKQTDEEILRTIYNFRFANAQDVSQLLFSPASLTYVRARLTTLAGNADLAPQAYLCRFPLPTDRPGNRARVFTLGSLGRDFLEHELGLAVDWYFRPSKFKHVSFNQIMHTLTLTRFLVAAETWSNAQADMKLTQRRTCYELAGAMGSHAGASPRTPPPLPVIFDAWLKFERVAKQVFYPVILEIDRGMEHSRRFKQHVGSRLAFLRSQQYQEVFGVPAGGILAYATTGQTPSYRETRRRAMCAWTREVLDEMGLTNWAHIFRFTSLVYEDIYATPLFTAPIWYRLDQAAPVPFFA
jgi:hypothetical protein